jgi:hypothetical protein
MKFWKQLRLLGSIFVLILTVLTLIAALMRAESTDASGDIAPMLPQPAAAQLAPRTTGL